VVLFLFDENRDDDQKRHPEQNEAKVITEIAPVYVAKPTGDR
jgi:hypothetical protein